MQSNLGMHEHVDNLVSKAGQGMYALKILKSNGLADRVLNTVSQATLLSPMTYASVAWWGFANSEDRARLQSSLNRAHRWGLFDSALPPNFSNLCDKADGKFFSKICSTPDHILHSMLPAQRSTHYNFRARSHNYALPLSSPCLQRNFLHRLLFKDAY